MRKPFSGFVVCLFALGAFGCGSSAGDDWPGGGEVGATAAALSANEQSAGAVVIVNSTSASYPDFARMIQPYLDHFGVPYELLDIATDAVDDDAVNRALIIIGHNRLDETLTFLTAAEQGSIVDAVASGSGLVSFDRVLASGGSPIYSFAQDLLQASYGSNRSAGSIEIQEGPLHFIVERHDASELIDLKSSMTVLGMTPSPDSDVVASAGGEPLVTTRSHGQGKVVQWGSYDWISNSVKGPVYGLDDLVWRSMVWAARKPFVMQGLPNFLTMRVDDADGRGLEGPASFDWLDMAIDDFGYKPWVGVFSRDINATEGAMLSQRANAGEATVSIHSFRTDEFFFLDHYVNWGDWPDSVMANHFTEGTQWHLDHDIPISKLVLPHLYEIGTNAFQGLADWGVEFAVTQMEPGNLYGAPGLLLGPFRKFETQPSDSTDPHYYADFLEVPGHPEFDGQFFNCVTEVRDDAGYEWYPSDDVNGSIGRGTRQSKRAFDSMVLATLFTHEYLLNYIQPANFRLILEGIQANLAPYNPEYVTLDYACQYVRAMATSNISQTILDRSTGVLTTSLTGSADMDTRFYLFTQNGNDIVEQQIDVPAFVGSVQVAEQVAEPCVGDCPAGVSLDGLNQVYDGTPRVVTVTTTPPGLAVDVTYDGSPTPPTEIGSYAVVATVTEPGYTGSANGTLVISAEVFPATVGLSGLSQIYDGTPRIVTATTTPPGLAVEVTYDGSLVPPVDVGSYTVIGTVTEPSYVGSSTGTLTVSPAIASVTLEGLVQVYDGTPRVVAATTTPPGLAVEVTYDGSLTPPVDTGAYAIVATVTDPSYTGTASGTLFVNTDTGGGPAFCDTAPASSAQFCDDFEDGLDCTDPLRVPLYTSVTGSAIDCASQASPIDGGYSLELNTGTANDQLHCDDGNGSGCFGPAMTGVTCTRFALRVDEDGTSNAEDVFVPRDSGDSENMTLQIDPRDAAGASDMDAVAQPGGVRLANSMVHGDVKIWCLQQDFDNFESAVFSGNDCGTTEVASLEWNWQDNHGGFRIRAFLDNANAHIDNITVHQGACPDVWNNAPTPATVTLGGLSQEYDGTPRAVSVTTSPPGLPVEVTYDGSPTPPVEVGSYAVVAVITDPGYTGSASGTLVVSEPIIPATVTLGGLSQTYDGTPRAVTATTVPAGLAVSVTYDGNATPPTAVGSYAVSATVTEPGYSGSASGTLVVSQASATIALGGLTQTYDGTPRVVTATTTPPGLAVSVTYDGNAGAPTGVGSYAVAATVTDPNYSGSAGGTLVVSQASATVTLGGLTQTYDGTPRVVTATTTPPGLAVSVTYDGSASAPTDVGSYSIVAVIADPSYTGAANGTLVVGPGAATVALDGLSQVYDGTPRVVTATTTPPGLAVSVTYDGSASAPTEIGSYSVVATVTDPNYTGSASGTLVVADDVLPATVVLSGLNQSYDGTARVVTATTIPAGLAVSVTYDGSPIPPVAVGSYAVVATVTDPGYTGSSTGTLVVDPGVATVTLGALNQLYDGTPRPVTVTTTPPGLPVSVTYDGSSTPPTEVGSYAVVATVTDPNYTGSASGTLVIDPSVLPATVILSGLSQTYDGTARVVTATTIPAGLTVTVTYDGSPIPPIGAGSYVVIGTVDDPIYVGSTADSLVVDPASAAVTLSGLSQTYDGTPRVVTATTTPAGLPVEVTYDGSLSAPIEVGSYAVLATVTDPNYTGFAGDTLVVDPDTGGTDFCDTAPASSAQFCDDFEDGLDCTNPARAPAYSSQVGSAIDCASQTSPIDGNYSLELTTGTANDQIHCDDGSCFGPALSSVTCTRFALRIDDDGTSTGSEDLFVPRDSGDSENMDLQIDPAGQGGSVDVIVQPDGTRLSNSMALGATKIWCLQQDFNNFESAVYSGADCATAEEVPLGWSWNDDHGGFRIRAFLDNANAQIDNITVHEGRCGDIW